MFFRGGACAVLLGPKGGHLGQEFPGAAGCHFLPVETIPEASTGGHASVCTIVLYCCRAIAVELLR